MSAASLLAWCLPLVLYWVVLGLRIPYALSGQLSRYSTILFLAVLASYYLAFRQRGSISASAGLTLTMLLVALSVSYLWSSGRSDTDILGGLLPYKDAKNYYFGALQILNGLPLHGGINAIRRPLFPGLVATLLFLAGGNLKIVTALLAQLVGLSLFVSARTLRPSLGPAAAALYSALMYFHIQTRLGYILSETSGFALGCLALAILWAAAPPRNWRLIGLGLAVLMAAISTRAGAYFIFPLLAVWCGILFRGARRFSLRAALVCLAGAVLLYLLMNQLYSALLDVRLVDQWDNFAYALYGQVHGGTGWHSAIADLNSTQTWVVAAAAWHYFLAHPLDLLHGIARSYRDFFWAGDLMIFPFGSAREPEWTTYVLWAVATALLVLGQIKAWRYASEPRAALLLTALAGILLSIPFLPPVDGGARFQAASISFLFVIPALALAGPAAWKESGPVSEPSKPSRSGLGATLAVILLMLTIVAPVAIYRLTPARPAAAPACPAGQEPFTIKTLPQGHVDVLPLGAGACGLAPLVCRQDFEKNARDKVNDDLTQALLAMLGAAPNGIRITPALNFQDLRFGYFLSSPAESPAAPSGQIVSGCGTLIETANSRLYLMDSLASAPIHLR